MSPMGTPIGRVGIVGVKRSAAHATIARGSTVTANGRQGVMTKRSRVGGNKRARERITNAVGASVMIMRHRTECNTSGRRL